MEDDVWAIEAEIKYMDGTISTPWRLAFDIQQTNTWHFRAGKEEKWNVVMWVDGWMNGRMLER